MGFKILQQPTHLFTMGDRRRNNKRPLLHNPHRRKTACLTETRRKEHRQQAVFFIDQSDVLWVPYRKTCMSSHNGQLILNEEEIRMVDRSWVRWAKHFVHVLPLVAIFLTTFYAVAKGNNTGYQYYLDGTVTEPAKLTQAGLLLAGGATDQDDAMSRFMAQADNGNIVVLDAYGKNSYGPYIMGLGAQSVQTFVFNNRNGAYDPFLVNALRNADAIFIDGGNQWDYVNFWKGTPVEDALNLAALKKPVGGISAGLAILGNYVFTAQQGTVTSEQALKNPYYSHVNLANNFLSLPNMGGIITDTHFATRDRMGRTITFLARILQDGWSDNAFAVAVEQGTTLWVDPKGSITFYGSGGAYFLRTTHSPEICQKGTPLTFTNVEVYKIADPSASFDLNTWTGKGGNAYSVSSINGELRSSQPDGAIY